MVKESFISTFNKLIDMVLLNILFIVTCIPVITVGASISALYYVIFHMSENTESYVVRSYLRAWKDNFKKATPIWIAAILCMVMFRLNFQALTLMPKHIFWIVLYAVQILAVLVLYNIFQYYFPLTAVFENSMINTVKNSFYLSFKHLPKTFACLCITVLPFMCIFFVPAVSRFVILFMLLIGFSAIAYAETFLFKSAFKDLE